MRTELVPGARAGRAAALLAAALTAAALAPGVRAEEGAGSAEGAGKPGADWESWRADNEVSDMASLQRGARNFVSYCLGCHSLKYERWSRMAADLAIPERLLRQDLLPAGEDPGRYMLSVLPAADGEAWFGKAPPDLSLMARARGRDYLFQFLKTFYVDPARPTGTNNLRLPSTAMPQVLSELEGLKRAVFRQAAAAAEASA